jgi:hypothetical protein
MKVVAKLFADLVAWRWAPAAGLLAASTLFIFVVVGLVPTEIGVPVANTKFVPRTLSTAAATSNTNSETTTASFADQSPAAEAPAPAPRVGSPVTEFGRRGFSPRLDRPDVPPPPSPSPEARIAAPPVPAPGGPIGGIFSRIQGALRPGSQAAAALAPANVAPPAPPVAPDPNAAANAAEAAMAQQRAPVGAPGAPVPPPGTPAMPPGAPPYAPPGAEVPAAPPAPQ